MGSNDFPVNKSFDWLSKLVEVTDANKKDVLVFGRILYVAEKLNKDVLWKGFFEIRPALKKGKIGITNHSFLSDHQIFVSENEDVVEYKESYQSIVKLYMSKKELFYNPSEKLVNYKKL